MHIQPGSGRKTWWPSWSRCFALMGFAWGLQLSAAISAAGAALGATDEPNGAPRALTFQVHDPEQATERRLALVLGNSTYSNSPLANPANDARAMSAKLRQLGFEVMEKENATREDMVRLSREFGNRLKLGGVGVFYYAGHGVQLNGINYLLPVDSDIQDETELQTRAYDINEMLNKMDSAKNRLNIVILDACRNNPLMRATRSDLHGLATMQQGTGTIVAYATQPGATAADGPVGGNSLYTQQLLLALSQPGLRVEDVFKQVRMEVYRRSGGVQTPWENSSLIGEFYFNRGAGGSAVPADGPSTAPPIQVASLNEPRQAGAARELMQPSPVLVPRRLLDSYQLASNLSMPAPMSLAVFSANNARFALVTQDKQLRVWEIATGNMAISQDGFDVPVATADNRFILGVADDHSVNVLDLNANPLAVRTVRGLDAQRAVIASKAQRLVVVNHTGAVSLYDFDSGRPVGASAGKVVGEAHIELAPGGSRALVWGSPESDMLLLDLQTGKRVGKISGHDKPPVVVRFSHDGNFLLTSFDGGNAIVYRTADGNSLSKLALGGSNATLSQAEFLGDGKELLGYVAVSDPKQGVLHRLAIWDTSNGKLAATVAQGAAVTDMRYSPDSQKIYFSMSDNTINVFELNTKTKRTVLTDATLAGFSGDGQRVLAREGDGMRLYDARTFSPIARMPSQTSAFLQPNAGGVFATAASDGKVSLWEFEHGDPVAQLKGHIDAVEQVVFSPGGKRLVSFGKGRTAKLWGLPEVQDLEKLKRDEFESSGDYTRRVSEWTSPYTALVSLVEYNADSEAYTVRIGDVTLTLPTPRTEARRFAGQREGILTGRLKVFDVEQLQLSDVKLSRLP
jgi:WD40 repeat protein